MEAETKRRSIFATLIAIAGILVNALIANECKRDAVGQYGEYLENLEIYAKDSSSHMIEYRYGLYKLDRMSVIFAIACIVIYVLIAIFQRLRPLYLIIPAGGIAFSIYSATIAESYKDVSPIHYVAIALFVAAFALTIPGVIKGKARFAFISSVLAAIGIAALLFSGNMSRSALLENASICNVLGSEVIFFFALNALRQPKAKPAKQPTQTPTQATTPTAPVAEIPTPAVSGSSQILSANTLIIDEKISMGKKTFKILNEQGAEIGFISESISGGANASRVLLGKGTAIFQAAQLQVCELDGTVVLGTSKQGLYGSVTDANGNIICTLKKSNLLDKEGNSIMHFRSTLKDGSYIETPSGEVVANFKKKYLSAKAAFTSADTYTVTITPGTPADQRIIAIGTVLIWEMITGNK